MATPVIQTFDHRRQMIVSPSEIKLGDWLRDLGALRRVESIDMQSTQAGEGMLYILHFVPQAGIGNRALGISSSTDEVTVWREL